jgi:hypothetical protein
LNADARSVGSNTPGERELHHLAKKYFQFAPPLIPAANISIIAVPGRRCHLICPVISIATRRN